MIYRHQEILETLLNGPQSGMTTAEIYSHAVKQPGSELRYVNKDVVSKLLYALRGGKAPCIASSDAKGGAKHQLTDAGRKAIADWLEKQNAPKNHPEPVAETRVAVDVADDQSETQKPLATDQPEPPQPLSSDATTKTGDGGEMASDLMDMREPAIDAAVDSFARDGYLLLDPNSEIDAPLIAVAQLFRVAASKPARYPLENAEEKISLLRFMQSFHGKLNEDVDKVLGDIIHDLEQLEAA